MAAIFNWAYNAFFGGTAQAEEITVHTWAVGEKEVQLLRREEQLDCLVIDHATREKWRIDPPPDPRPVHERIDHLLQREPIIGVDYSVTFAKRTEHPRWPRRQFADGKTIALAHLGKNLIWRQFSEQESHRILAVEDVPNLGTYLYELSPQARELSQNSFRQQENAILQIAKDENISDEQIPSEVQARCLQSIPLANRIAYFRDFTIVGSEGPSKLTSVALKKISAISRIDGKTPIDRSNWAVTVLCCGRDWHGHAVIAYEGVEKGKPFLNYAHLVGNNNRETSPGEVELLEEGQENWRQLKYQGKTETWLRKRDRIKTLEKSVQWEIAQRKKTPVYFNFMGSDSFLKSPIIIRGTNWNYVLDATILPREEVVVPYMAQPHNCITWAREKLRLAGIELPIAQRSHIFTLPTEYIGSTSSTEESLESPRLISNSEDSLPLKKLQALQEASKKEIRELEGALMNIERELRKPMPVEGRLTLEADRRAKGRNSPPALRGDEITDMTLIEKKRIERIELICEKNFFELRVYREKLLINLRDIIICMKEAEEKGNVQEKARLKRAYLAYTAFMECNAWSGGTLEDLYCHQRNLCATYSRQLGEVISSNKLSYLFSQTLSGFFGDLGSGE